MPCSHRGLLRGNAYANHILKGAIVSLLLLNRYAAGGHFCRLCTLRCSSGHYFIRDYGADRLVSRFRAIHSLAEYRTLSARHFSIRAIRLV